jgi:hypothetical protein
MSMGHFGHEMARKGMHVTHLYVFQSCLALITGQITQQFEKIASKSIKSSKSTTKLQVSSCHFHVIL